MFEDIYMNNKSESLLNAWLRLSTSVINPRLVSEMSYNESLVCNILYNNYCENPSKKITATDLCHETKMLKSQMNRTLNLLEKKNIIIKERSPEDKRQIWISFDFENAQLYKAQHDRILKLVDAIIDRVGEEQAFEAIHLISALADAADKVIHDLNTLSLNETEE